MADQTVTDALGRKLVVRELSALEDLDLIEAAGALAENSRWMSNVRLACSVRDIDGTPAAFPKVKEHCRKAVARVGREGMEATLKALYPAAMRDGSDDEGTDNAAPDQAAEDKATAKN